MEKKRRSRLLGKAIFAAPYALIVTGGLAIPALADPKFDPTQPYEAAVPNETLPLAAGERRKTFLIGAIPKCITVFKATAGASENKQYAEFGKTIADRLAPAYCACVMQAVADKTTMPELLKMIAGILPLTIEEKENAVKSICLEAAAAREP